MKNKIIEFIKINCYAFTAVTIISECFYLLNHNPNGNFDIIGTFVITSTIAVLIMLIEGFSFKRKKFMYLIEILIVIMFPIGATFLFNGSEVQVFSIILNAAVSIGVFMIVTALFFIESTINANSINQKIKKMKETLEK